MVKAIPDGVSHAKDWLGEGGQVTDPKTAQRRANTCQTCSLNKVLPLEMLTLPAALAIKAQLGVKNKLGLRVDGEKKLKSCDLCGCQLRLQIWLPQDKIESHLTEDEIRRMPSFCWKIKKQ